MRIKEVLQRQKQSVKTAIKCGEESFTYKQWNEKAENLCKKIVAQASMDSKNVAIFLPNSISYAVAYFAAAFADKVVVPIGVKAKGPEIRSTLQYCEIDLILTDTNMFCNLKDVLEEYPYQICVLLVDDERPRYLNWECKKIEKTFAIGFDGTENDVFLMLHTSGTTSNPKRVMLTHHNLLSNIESNVQSLQLTAQDVTLITLPMHFGYCNTAQFLTHVYLGATIVILEGIFYPKSFFDTVQRESVTNFTCVPTALLLLLQYRFSSRYDVSSLRYICFGGSSIPAGQLEQLIHMFPTVGFVQTYGQTEASPRITALLPKDCLRKLGSVGKPIPHVCVTILLEDGTQAPPYQIGEIVVQGPNVMKGYYKRDDITGQTIVNGWLHTGDLGYVDSEGYYFLTGRKKNMIISGGINIYPEEIEEILLQHPDIEEAYVFSEADAVLNEVPAAKIKVSKYGIDINALRDYCSQRLASYKIPTKFDIVAELPKTYNGKLKRY